MADKVTTSVGESFSEMSSSNNSNNNAIEQLMQGPLVAWVKIDRWKERKKEMKKKHQTIGYRSIGKRESAEKRNFSIVLSNQKVDLCSPTVSMEI